MTTATLYHCHHQLSLSSPTSTGARSSEDNATEVSVSVRPSVRSSKSRVMVKSRVSIIINPKIPSPRVGEKVDAPVGLKVVAGVAVVGARVGCPGQRS
jgi:hypothetical protein